MKDGDFAPAEKPERDERRCPEAPPSLVSFALLKTRSRAWCSHEDKKPLPMSILQECPQKQGRKVPSQGR